MNIDEMQAGREMDALIAEMVMGWAWFGNEQDAVLSEPSTVTNKKYKRLESKPANERHSRINPIPHYSTEIAAAWQVVDKIIVDSPYLAIKRDELYGNWFWKVEECGLFKGNYWKPVYAETAPLAICRAALKVIQAQSTKE